MKMKEVLDFCLKKLDLSKQIHFLFWYGSRKNKADIDLLVVLKNEPPFEIGYKPSQKVDIYIYPYKIFKELAFLFDPQAVEPVLSGKLLLGDQQKFEKFKKELLKTSPSSKIVSHLKNESQRWFHDYHSFLADFEKTKNKNFLVYALVDLSYALSYELFSRHYSQNQHQGPISLKELQERYPESTLWDILAYLKKVKRNRSLLSVKEIQRLMKNENRGQK